MSEPIYFTDAAGVRYRVLDARMHQGKMALANPPAAWATFRVFRPEQGQRRLYYRLYYFKPGESRAPEPGLLDQQRQRAEYFPSGPAQEPAADPR
jgi:hypothetical protein